MADWPSITDDDGSGLTGTIFNKAFFDLIKAFIQAGSHQSGLDADKPATCSPGDTYHATDTEKLYVCFVANTWSELGGAAPPEQVRLPEPEAGDFATPTVHDKSSEIAAPSPILGAEGAMNDRPFGTSYMGTGIHRVGQRITLNGDDLKKVSFLLSKVSSPTGTVYARIRRVSDDSIIETSSTTYVANDLPTEKAWKDFAFTCAPNEEVHVAVEYYDGTDTDYIILWYDNADTIPGAFEYCSVYNGETPHWYTTSGSDCSIRIYFLGFEATNTVDEDINTFWQPDGFILNQTEGDYTYHLAGEEWYQRSGQRITLTGQNLSYVRFYLKKVGSPSGNVYCRIRRTSDDGIIETSATVYTANELSTEYEWKEFALSSSPDEEVYICVEPSGGDYDNYIDAYLATSDVCDGCHVYYTTGAGYTVNSGFDTTIILAFSDVSPWISWDIGSLKFVGGCRIYWGSEVAYRPTEYKLYVSVNGTDWTEVIHETEAAPASAWKTYQWYVRYARYFKLVVITLGASGTKVYEVDGYSLSQEDTTQHHGHGGLS